MTGLFQGTLLFFLLAADVFIHYRLRCPARAAPAQRAPRTSSPMMDMRHAARRPDARRRHAARVRGARRARHREVGRAESRRRGHDAGRRGRRRSSSPRHGQSPWLGVAAGIARRRRAVADLRACSTLTLQANQVAIRPRALALRRRPVGVRRPRLRVASSSTASRRCAIPGSSDLPVIGPLLFGHNPLVYLSLVAVRRASSGSCTARAPASCCARSASRRSRRTRSAIR